ncbi:MAG TPA: MFS transporter [Kineosporiaceae bacterium]
MILGMMFMSMFDSMVAQVAAPSIRQALGMPETEIQLAIGGYAFSLAAFLVMGGRMGDRYGRRLIFISGIVLFTLASLGCGVAQTGIQLILWRVLQGVGGSAMVPQCLALIGTLFPPQEKPRAVAFYAAMAGLGLVSAQLLGGGLLTLNILGLGWRPVFIVNVPVGIVTVICSLALLPEAKSDLPEPFDVVGLVGLAVGMGLVLVPITLGPAAGWPAWTWLSLQGGGWVLSLFFVWEARMARLGGSPMFPIGLMKDRKILSGMLSAAGLAIVISPFVFIFTYVMQIGQHLTPFMSGLMFAPNLATFMVVAVVARKRVARHGPRILTAGILLATVALVTASRLGVDATFIERLSPMVLFGAGTGLAMPTTVNAVVAGIHPRTAGAVTGTLGTVQQVSTAIGIAGFGSIFLDIMRTSGMGYALQRSMLVLAMVMFGAGIASLFIPRPVRARHRLPRRSAWTRRTGPDVSGRQQRLDRPAAPAGPGPHLAARSASARPGRAARMAEG